MTSLVTWNTIEAHPELSNLSDRDLGQLLLQLNPDSVGQPTTRLYVPRPLGQDEATERSIGVLDRIPIVDYHKIGVLYVGPRQTNETEILANTSGSASYQRFIDKLGDLITLKNVKNVYTGGLDTVDDTDGPVAPFWHDAVTQVIFHVATLMPTDLERDPKCTLKKRHIGNNFVSIVFNDSNAEYSFDTVPSEFNFVQYVVSPIDAVSFGTTAKRIRPPSNPDLAGQDRKEGSRATNDAVLAGAEAGNTKHYFFKVQMLRKTKFAETGPAAEFKIISAESLPAFIRQVVVHADIFSQVYLQSEGTKEYTGIWKARLQQIRRIEQRNRPAGE